MGPAGSSMSAPQVHTVIPSVAYNTGDGHAHPALAQDRLDHLVGDLGAGLLAALWRTELSLFLRYWKRTDWNRTVAGKPADLFLDSLWFVTVSISVYSRSCRRIAQRTSSDRRD